MNAEAAAGDRMKTQTLKRARRRRDELTRKPSVLILAADLLLVSLAMPAGGAAEPKGLVAEGAALSRDACSACHQVSPRQKPPPPVFDADQAVGIPAPSFMKIASDRQNSAADLQRMITRPHYPMREQAYDKDDLDAIVAYILSLRPPAPR
jgi:mono/diheme cytochrome c family protein